MAHEYSAVKHELQQKAARVVTFALGLLLSGCYLHAVVPLGGDVQSLSGFRDCASGEVCEFIVGHTGFSETFTAVAAEGYEFKGWHGGNGFACGNEVSATCAIDLFPLTAVPSIEALVLSNKVGFIMPLFERVDSGEPVAGVVDGNGVLLGSIFDESYPFWVEWDPTFSGGTRKVRYSIREERFIPGFDGGIYYGDDECSSSLAYADSTSVAAFGFYALGPDPSGLFFYWDTITPATNVLVGSRSESGVCVDIPDEINLFWPLIELGVYDVVTPITRSPGPIGP